MPGKEHGKQKGCLWDQLKSKLLVLIFDRSFHSNLFICNFSSWDESKSEACLQQSQILLICSAEWENLGAEAGMWLSHRLWQFILFILSIFFLLFPLFLLICTSLACPGPIWAAHPCCEGPAPYFVPALISHSYSEKLFPDMQSHFGRVVPPHWYHFRASSSEEPQLSQLPCSAGHPMCNILWKLGFKNLSSWSVKPPLSPWNPKSPGRQLNAECEGRRAQAPGVRINSTGSPGLQVVTGNPPLIFNWCLSIVEKTRACIWNIFITSILL